MAFFVAIQIARLAHHGAGHEPVGQPTTQLRGNGEIAGGGGAVGLGKGGFGRCNVAAMAIDHEHPFEAMAAQGQHQVVQNGQKRCWLQAHRSRETKVVFRHAKGLSWGDQNAGATTHLKGHRFCGEGVCADGARGTVLLGGSQGDDHPLAALEVALHFRPTAQGEANGVRAVDRTGSCSGHSG